ncbi:MAG: hypothetical protein JW889_07775 [Verrucomicrobia bacterium]|nr:hypothetical protein [Verrucomicrobiota bacterium]
MRRASALIFAVVVAGFGTVCGCGGGDDDSNTLSGGTPAYIVGTWTGTMTHRIIDYNHGTDVTTTYGIVFYILSQDGTRVSGKLQLKDSTHVGDLRGVMDGNHFTGVRTGLHTVQIEFTVNGSSLTGTFRFAGDGLDEWGDYTCTKQ